ncbi:MAG: hypothetical protein JST80_03585 [Bdellovibrionales bacterium]|nr:hypothetical protein [Bdellovibrionales bacterium]
MKFTLGSFALASLCCLVLASYAATEAVLQSDKTFLAHEGDCSVATKKLSNQLVRTLSEIHDAPNLPTAVGLIKNLLAPHQRQPGGSPAMTAYKESVLSREVRDASNPFTILELRSQFMFFNSTGAICFKKSDNVNMGMAELDDTSFAQENFSTYILKLPKNIYAKITFSGNREKTSNYVSKGVPIMDNTLDKYNIAFGRPENALVDYKIADPMPCSATAGGEYETRAVAAQKFVSDAVKIIRDVSVADTKPDDTTKQLVRDYEYACGKMLYDVSKSPFLAKPAAIYRKSIESLKEWTK